MAFRKLCPLLAVLVCQTPRTSGQDANRVRLMVQVGREAIYSAVFSPDGRRVLISTYKGMARLSDIETGRDIRRFNLSDELPGPAAFSPDGKLILAGTYNHPARLLERETGREIQHFEGIPGSSLAAAFSRDGRFLLTTSDNVARLWEAATGGEIRRFEGHSDFVNSAGLSPDGRMVATASTDKTARLWDANTGREVRRLEGHSGPVKSANFSPDGKLIVTASEDKTARVWDAATGHELRQYTHSERINSAVFSPDGKLIVTSSDDMTARLWNAETGQELHRFQHENWVTSAVFSPDSKQILTASDDASVRLWEWNTGREIRRIEGQSDMVNSVAFSRDGRFVVTAGRDKTAALWDLAAGRMLRRFEGHTQLLASAVFSRDGRYVLTAAWDATARLWETETGREIRRFKAPVDIVESAVFSPDGKLVLLAGWNLVDSDRAASVFETATGREIRRLKNQEYPAVFSPDGSLILTTDTGFTARLFEANSGREIRHFGEILQVKSAIFSPDGNFVLTLDKFAGLATLWETGTGREVRHFQALTTELDFAAFSPDGKFIIGAGNARAARISDQGAWMWETATGRQVRAFTVQTDTVQSAVFSPDGQFVLTANADGTTWLWSASEAKKLAMLVHFLDGSWAVTDPDGRYDASNPDEAVGLHWTVGDEIIEIGQLKNRFYTPRLLARILRGEALPDVGGRIQQVNLYPDVVLGEPADNRISVRLINRGGGIGRVVVKVNGRELSFGTRGADSATAHAPSETFTVDLTHAALAPDGKNVIEVSAYDASGLVSSRGVRRLWTMEPAATSQPRLFGIGVGVSRYANDRLNLAFAAKDAEDIAAALQLGASRLFGAAQTEIQVLSTGGSAGTREPSKQNIRQAFEDIARQATPNDILVVYLAGHGVARGGSGGLYFFLTQEARTADLNDAALLDISSVSSEELKEWCLRIKALKQVIVLDTCAAGAANEALLKLAEKRDLSPDQIRAMELLKDSTGSHVLMGSAADSVSYEANRYGQGLLTYALLQGMKGAALVDGQRVDVSRLFDYAQSEVQVLARGIGGIQRPIISSPKGASFPIGLLNDSDKRGIRLASVKPQVLQVICSNDSDIDEVNLTPLVRERLRNINTPLTQALLTRGSTRVDPPLVYLDSVINDVPGAVMPRVRYWKKQGMIRARITLIRDGHSLAVQWRSAPAREIDSLATQIVDAITRELEKLPPS